MNKPQKEAMTQFLMIQELEKTKEYCKGRQGCYSCPFCMYELETLMKEGFKPVSELCSLYPVFKTIPSQIDTERLCSLIKGGRK